MTKREQVKQAVQNILDTCPHYNNKVYLLEDYEFGMNSIDVMFDTHYEENKCIKLDTRIPSKDIYVGDVCNMFIKDKSRYSNSDYRCLYLLVKLILLMNFH